MVLKYKMFTLFLLFLSISKINAQCNNWISGFLTDQNSGEALINATVYNSKTLKGTLTNQFGYFAMPALSVDSVELVFSYVGYKTQRIKLIASRDTILNVALDEGVEIDQINVSSNHPNSLIKQFKTGTIELKSKLVEELPSLFGEPDLARVLQLMPGVQSGKEGTGGIFVRGGSNDQNLIILDDMPIFNANHIGGFVSVFNPSAINHLTLYKGGFPAKYGGRLSSILDIQMKDGNLNEQAGGYSLGTLTSSVFYEGPIRKDTSSFLISCRRTLYDFFLSAYYYLDTKGESDGGYTLWDINAKYNRKLDENRRLYISFYQGRDLLYRKNTSKAQDEVIITKSKYKNYWGNRIVSVRLNHRLNSKTFVNYVLGISKYEYVIKNSTEVSEPTYSGIGNRTSLSNMSQVMCSANFESVVNSIHNFNYGLTTTAHFFIPVSNNYSKEENQKVVKDSVWGNSIVNTPELSFYFSDKISIADLLNVEVGVRSSNFWIEKELEAVLEPRFLANYKFNEYASLNFSYTQMSQFIHLVSGNDQAYPSEFWFPSTKGIEPERSSQLSIGTFFVFQGKDRYQMSLDLYLKGMKNLLEQKSTGLFLGESINWEQQLETGGIGRAYGAEILIEKTTGKTTGWLAYTLSKNERKFVLINDGTWYPYRYDRRHELSFVLNHQFTNRLSFHANWVFMSGEALSLPSYKYLLNVQQFGTENYVFSTYAEANSYNGKNGFRTPAYHRLDFNINFTKEKANGNATWSLGLYNAYNSTNAFYYYFAKNEQGNIRLHALTLFPIIPSISYRFRF